MISSQLWPPSRSVVVIGSGLALSVCAYSAYKYWQQNLALTKTIDEGFEDVSRNEEKSDVVRVLVIGLANAGKSTLISLLLGLSVEDEGPTEGSKVSMVCMGNKSYNIWEVGGGDKYRRSWVNFLEDTNLVIFVVDSADVKSFTLASQELKNILANERLHGVPLLVVANKQDLPGATKALELFKLLDLGSVCSQHLTTCVPMQFSSGSETHSYYLDRIRQAIKDMAE